MTEVEKLKKRLLETGITDEQLQLMKELAILIAENKQ